MSQNVYLFWCTWLIAAALMGSVFYVSEQKPINIALIKILVSAIFIFIPAMMALMIVIGTRGSKHRWAIRLGGITNKSHPLLYYSSITGILVFLAAPVVIGILTASNVIPFKIKINGQVYVDEPARTPVPIVAPEADKP